MRSLRTFLVCALCVGVGCKKEEAADPAATAPEPAEPAPEPAPADKQEPIAVTGDFQTPESVLFDADQDVYLVSNINGSPLDKDDNGFLSRVSPDGQIVELKWIDAAKDDVTLHAPKGMTIVGDTLYVTDIDVVRRFDRKTGAPRGEIAIEGATFLNDLVSEGDTVYVSDSGMKAGKEGFEPAGTDAIYAITGDKARPVAKGKDLKAPNGLRTREGNLWVVTFGANELYRLTPEGKKEQVTTLPAGSLDGLAIQDDGTFLVSSWEGKAVYAGTPEGSFSAVVENVESPADIGWDSKRRRVLIPLFMKNSVQIHPVTR